MNLTTPANGEFMVAGYVVAGIVYLGYTLLLVRRQRALDRRWRTLPMPPARPAAPPPPDAAA
jgi:hypothetical protein